MAERVWTFNDGVEGLEEGKELSLRWSMVKDALSGVFDHAFVVSASAHPGTIEAMDEYLARKLRARSGR